MPIIEVRNTISLRAPGSKSLNEFRKISMDLIVTEGPLAPYGSQRATIYGSAWSWGSWGTSLVNFRSVDTVTASRAFYSDQILMDEEEAHAILLTTGFMGPWDLIYLCKLPASGLLFYVFQEPRQIGSTQTIYQLVAVEDGRVRVFYGAAQYPCSYLPLVLTMNVTFQVEPANRTDFRASPSGSTNITSQNVFEVEGVLSENTTAF